MSGGANFSSFCVSHSSAKDVPELQSTQEESDTRIILHAKEAANHEVQRLVVCSPNTDVFMLLLHHYPSLGVREIFFCTGREGKHTSLRRFIPIHQLYSLFSAKQHSILLPIYCITGCDTVSSFYGHGKWAAFKILFPKAGDYSGFLT